MPRFLFFGFDDCYLPLNISCRHERCPRCQYDPRPPRCQLDRWGRRGPRRGWARHRHARPQTLMPHRKKEWLVTLGTFFQSCIDFVSNRYWLRTPLPLRVENCRKIPPSSEGRGFDLIRSSFMYGVPNILNERIFQDIEVAHDERHMLVARGEAGDMRFKQKLSHRPHRNNTHCISCFWSASHKLCSESPIIVINVSTLIVDYCGGQTDVRRGYASELDRHEAPPFKSSSIGFFRNFAISKREQEQWPNTSPR